LYNKTGTIFDLLLDSLNMTSSHVATFDMTPEKSAILTSAGGLLAFVKVLITTGQIGDAMILGFSGAVGAFSFSILIWAGKKLWDYFKPKKK